MMVIILMVISFIIYSVAILDFPYVILINIVQEIALPFRNTFYTSCLSLRFLTYMKAWFILTKGIVNIKLKTKLQLKP